MGGHIKAGCHTLRCCVNPDLFLNQRQHLEHGYISGVAWEGMSTVQKRLWCQQITLGVCLLDKKLVYNLNGMMGCWHLQLTPFLCLFFPFIRTIMNSSINAANQALPRKTRASNVTKHPGLPDLPSKKRTPAEKQADEQGITNKQAAKVKTAVEQMGRLEQKMETAQATASASAKPVHPRPRPKVVKNRAADNEEASQPDSEASLFAMK